MNSYDTINSGICVECGAPLKDTSTLTKDKKKCENCGEEYYRPDDMGPGCWQHGGGDPKKKKES